MGVQGCCHNQHGVLIPHFRIYHQVCLFIFLQIRSFNQHTIGFILNFHTYFVFVSLSLLLSPNLPLFLPEKRLYSIDISRRRQEDDIQEEMSAIQN